MGWPSMDQRQNWSTGYGSATLAKAAYREVFEFVASEWGISEREAAPASRVMAESRWAETRGHVAAARHTTSNKVLAFDGTGFAGGDFPSYAGEH
jgi:hypothetical protein